MADVQHASLTDPLLHEPKGISSATVNSVYISDGNGTGNWTLITPDSFNYPLLVASIQDDIDTGDLELTGSYFVTVVFDDVSTADSIIVPVPNDATVVSARAVLGGAITDADASISFLNSAGASMGANITVAFSGSAKGDGYTFTATGNNELSGPSWFEIATDGASTGAQKLSVTVELSTVLNS